MQKMRGGMVGAGGAAALAIHHQVHRVADRKFAARDFHHMDMHGAQLLLGVGDLAFGLGRQHQAAIADLAAGLSIKWRLVGEDLYRFAGGRGTHFLAVLEDGQDLTFRFLGVVAQEFGAAHLVEDCEPLRIAGGFAGAGPAGARLGALLIHGEGKSVLVHRDAARPKQFLRQVQRESIGIVELESDIAGQAIAFLHAGGGFVQKLEAARQRFAEADFLQLQGFGNQGFGALQFRIGRAHLAPPGSAPAGASKGPSCPTDARDACPGA